MSLKSLSSELRGTCDLGFFLANHLPSVLPAPLAGRVRPRLLRLLGGVAIGDGVFMPAKLELNATRNLRSHLRIGSHCFVNSDVFVDANAPITLGDNVYVGHHTKLVTSGHAMGPTEQRAGVLTADSITIGNGVWIAAGATLLPGITVGAGAIIAAGAVVTRDVAANTLVGGVPAKVIRAL